MRCGCLSVWLGLLLSAPVWAQNVTVRVIVAVPESTPEDADVFLAGNHDALGAWKADGLKLARRKDGRYHGEFSVPAGTALEFKVTRGSWEGVEKSTDGGEVSNRTLAPETDTKITLSVSAWGDAAPPQRERQPTRTGTIRLHENFESKMTQRDRTLIVYLPPGYDKNVERRYPVFYMHDGQNVFDAATSFIGVEWQADEIAQRLIKAKRIPPLIIVGIFNNENRAMEYTPWPDGGRKTGGYGDQYARCVVEEIKPFIDKTYRTKPEREHTAIGGSSLGGLISLYICRKYPDRFGYCAAMSPALWWANRRIIGDYEQWPDLKPGTTRFWIDMGTREGRAVSEFKGATADARALVAVLDQKRLNPGRDYYYCEDFNAEHNERAWAARFDKVLLYFFGQ